MVEVKQEHSITIRTFGGLSFFKNDEDLTKDFQGSKKALEIFKYIITYYDQKISKNRICEVFWPEMEEGKAKQNLSSNLYYLRRGLDELFDSEGFGKHLIRANNKLCWINLPPGVNLDLIVLTDCYEQASNMDSNEQETKKKLLEKIIELYKADFLADEKAFWMDSKRAAMKDIAISSIHELIKMNYGSSEEKIENLFKRAFPIDPINQNIIAERLTYLTRNDDILGAMKLYKKYRKTLKEKYKLKVPPKIERLMKEIKSSQEIDELPEIIINSENYVDMRHFKELVQYELHKRSPDSLLLSIEFPSRKGMEFPWESATKKLFDTIRKSDRVSYVHDRLFVLFTETDKLSITKLIYRVNPYFENNQIDDGIRYSWHEIKPNMTSVITYGKWNSKK